MKDTIIKGAGNSRTLKSVPNAPTLYPSYDSFIQALATSGIPIDLLGLVAAGVQQAGTDLNKANLMSDAVEQAIWGNAADRNIGQALQQLRSLITTAQNAANEKAKVLTGTYAGTGSAQKTFNLPWMPVFMGFSANTEAQLTSEFAIALPPNYGGQFYNSSSSGNWSGRLVPIIANGNNLTFYNFNYVNRTEYTYTYIAIG